MTERDSVVVVGYGRIGLVHLDAVLRNRQLRLVALVGTNAQRCKNALEKALRPYLTGEGKLKDGSLPQSWTVEQLKQALQNPDHKIKYAVIASPTPEHGPLVSLFLNANPPVHVFVEKPLTTDPKYNQTLYETAALKRVALLTGYNRRFDDSFMKLQSSLVTKVGKVQLLRLSSRDHPPPPDQFLDSAGTFFEDFSTHDLDMARWLIGEEPVSVYACASRFLPSFKAKGIDDTAVIVLKFPSGCICVIDNSRRTTYGYDQRIEALGPLGMIQCANPRPTLTTRSTESGVATDSFVYSFPERYREAYAKELDHLISIAQGKEPPRITVTDVVQNALLTAKCQASRLQQYTPPTPHPPLPHYPTVKVTALKTPVRFALFGVGRMGAVRAEALFSNPHAILTCVYDVDVPRAKDVAAQYRVRCAESVDSALDADVDAVVISTTTAAHYELILAAAARKKHIFVEKPVALSTKETLECVRACESNNVLLYCGLQRRSDPYFRAAYHEIHLTSHHTRSTTGRPELIRITSRDAADHNTLAYLVASGNYWYDSLIHDFDVARWMANEEPIEVYAVGSASIPELAQRGDIDNVVVVLRFPSGAICTIDNNRRALYGYDQRLEVFGAHGMVQVDNPRQSELTYADFTGFHTDKTQPGLVRYKVAYKNEIDHFVNLLIGRETEPRVVPTDLVRLAQIADTAIESFKLGKPLPIQY
jgi:myo-inositol 2-dehydrogenase/D-chiro-inositol 1-dehydrogenase